jgi:hypothetical protein
MVISMLTNDPNKFPDYAEVIHRVCRKDEWLEIEIH